MEEAEEAEVLGEKYWSLARTATFLQVSRRHVRRLVTRRELPGLLLGGSIWVLVRAVRRRWQESVDGGDGRFAAKWKRP